jgi:cbb3-type cytochrome oxidase subunit 3
MFIFIFMVGYFVWLLRNAGKGRSIEFLTFG